MQIVKVAGWVFYNLAIFTELVVTEIVATNLIYNKICKITKCMIF